MSASHIPPEALNQLRFGRGLDNRRYKATGFGYGYTSREAVLKLGEHLRLHPLVRGGQEPYRYEREVEDFLRWSPHVRNAREKNLGSLNRDQLAELQRLLSGYAGAVGEGDSDTEQRVQAAERAAERAIQRAKKAEQRAAEAALKATERAKKAERRAGAAAEEAVQRVNAEAAKRAAQESAPASSTSPVEHYDDLAAEEVIALLASLERQDLQMLREHERRNANRASVLSAIDSVLARRETPV